ncbi:MAG: AAA family ATPase [Myxococcota bacterium]
MVDRPSREDPATKQRIQDYLEKIVPGIVGFERVALGPYESLEFRQRVQGAKHPWRFHPSSMSDGTLSALGVLVAVHQAATQHRATFVGIEEPEAALHPAAAGALVDALRSASRQTQVALTSHSPELLSGIDVDNDTLLVVQSEQGTSSIAPLDPANREAIKDSLYTAGELLSVQRSPSFDKLCRELEVRCQRVDG